MNPDKLYNFIYTVIYPLMHILFPLKVVGREKIPDGSAVVCVNHSSWWDPLIVAFAVTKKYHLHAMAKIEIMSYPVIGWLVKHVGSFGVDRGHNDIGAVKTALKYLKDGEKLLVFPEGTRVDNEDSSNAKSGIAMMAVRTNSPIVPIYVDSKKKMFHRTKVIIGDAIIPQIEGKRGTSEDYQRIAEDTMRTIYELKDK